MKSLISVVKLRELTDYEIQSHKLSIAIFYSLFVL